MLEVGDFQMLRYGVEIITWIHRWINWVSRYDNVDKCQHIANRHHLNRNWSALLLGDVYRFIGCATVQGGIIKGCHCTYVRPSLRHWFVHTEGSSAESPMCRLWETLKPLGISMPLYLKISPWSLHVHTGGRLCNEVQKWWILCRQSDRLGRKC